MRRLALALVVGSALASSRVAFAAPPDKQACVDAATRGQIQRDDQKFAAAEDAFAFCAQAVCPAAVRRSCAEWLADVQARMPEVRIRFVPSPARLFVDGSPVNLDAPLKVDPGSHTIRVERDGEATIKEDFQIAPGERKDVTVKPPPPPPEPAITTRRPVPILVPILGGVALAGFAGSIGFGLAAKSETDRLKDSCAPSCPVEERDSAFRTALVADIGLGIGIVAAALAGVFYFTRPTIRERAPTSLGLR